MEFKDFFYSFSLWTFIIFLFLSSCSRVEGQPKVIGSLQPILAAPGDDVILPCHLEPPFNVEGLTVEWSKPDLKPDPSDRLSRVGYVHLYRDRREVLDMKLESYISRTKLFTDELRHGNISLKIINVTPADTGRYRCFIPKLNSRVKESIITLIVDPDFIKTSTTETPLDPRNLQTPDPDDRTEFKAGRARPAIWITVTVVIIVLLVGLVGFYLYKKVRHEQDDPKAETIPSKQLLV